MKASTKARLFAILAAFAVCGFGATNALAQEQIGGAMGSLPLSNPSQTLTPVISDLGPNSLTPALQGVTSAPSASTPKAAAPTAAARTATAEAAAPGASSN
jgi:hypothetical protein